MKICMLTPYFPPHTGGTEKYVRDLSIELARKGNDVTVITNNVPIRAKAKSEEIIEGVKIKRLPAIDLFYLPITWAFNLKLINGYDVIHSHGPAFGFTRSVGKKLKIPHVVTYHCDTIMFDKFMGINIPKFIRDIFEETSNRYAIGVLPHVDAIISTSESYASSSPVLKNFPHFVVPIGIHYEKFDPIIKKLGITEEKRNKNQILFLGRLAANKGINFLIQAMPEVLKQFPDAKLIICGEGEESAHLKFLVKNLNVENSVTFIGVVNFEKLVELYSTSAVFVLPSINRLEAFGIVQLEAMACGTPVVASNIPGVNSVMEVGKSGLLAEPRNPHSLADCIIKILSNPEASREMGCYGRMLVEKKYNWDVIANQILDIYKQLIAKKG